MALICIAPPLVEPVSLPELKDMLRLSQGDTSQDDVLYTLNVAARNFCETICQRRFVEQTWRLEMDFFPGYIDTKLAGQRVSSPFVSGSNAVLVGIRYAIALPYPPVRSIVAFNYQDGNGSVTSMITTPASFVQDLDSQPARLTPLFGQMWPVARVVPNAVQVDFKVGFASVLSVNTDLTTGQLGGATFTSANVGQPISIPGVGANLGCLNTIIASVSGGVAMLRDKPAATLTATPALLVDHGTPGHWELAKLGIKVLVNSWYINRMPSFDARARDAVKAVLGPVMDKRY